MVDNDMTSQSLHIVSNVVNEDSTRPRRVQLIDKIMILQVFRSHFAVMSGGCQTRRFGCIQFWSDWDLSFSVQFLKGIPMYAWVYLRCVLRGIRTVKHFCCRNGNTHRQNTLPTMVLFVGDTLVDSSKKDVPTKHGVVGRWRRSNARRLVRRWFSGGATRRQPPHWCRCRSRGLRTRTNTRFRRLRWPLKYRKNNRRLLCR